MNLRYQEAPDRVAALTEIWRQVLGNPDLDEDSDLFENNGSSLHVLQITSVIYNVLGIDVKLRDVFSYTSPRSLAEFLEGQPGQAAPNAHSTDPR